MGTQEAAVAANRAEEAKKAGRGLLSITAAKLYFIVTSYGVMLALPRLLGSPEVFGLYRSAMNVVSIINNVLIAATIQTVSKMVSADEANAASALRRGLGIQLVIGIVLGTLGLTLAQPMADLVFLDSELGPLWTVSSLVFFAYALYAALVGSLNGRRVFQRQAGLDITFSTLRTAGIIGGAMVGTTAGVGALGALSGFAGAAIGVLVIATALVGIGKRGEAQSVKAWLAFMGPVALYQFFLNNVLQIDLPILKRTVAALSMDAGVDHAAAADIASRYAGFYGAAQTFAFVPYQLILSMTFVVFPMVSRATASGDVESTRIYIRGAMRFSLIVLLAVACPIAGAADGVMILAYPAEYLGGADALRILVLGMVAFSLFVISSTVLTGAGRPMLSAAIAFVAFAAVVVGNVVFVRLVGVGDQTVTAAALGTCAGTTTALALAGVAVYRSYRAFIPPLTVLRGAIAGCSAYAVAYWVPSGGRIMALVALAAGFVTCLFVLVVLREVTERDWASISRIVKRK